MVPRTIRRLQCREPLTEAKAITVKFDAFENRLPINGYLAMGGQIVDATLVAAPKQLNTQEERDMIKSGKTADEVWSDKPAMAGSSPRSTLRSRDSVIKPHPHRSGLRLYWPCFSYPW